MLDESLGPTARAGNRAWMGAGETCCMRAALGSYFLLNLYSHKPEAESFNGEVALESQ